MDTNEILKNMTKSSEDNDATENVEGNNENIDFNSFNLFDDENKPDINEKNSEKIKGRIDSKFAQLNQKEQQIDAKLQELNQKLEKIANSGDYSEAVKLKELAKENPMKVLESLGLSYEDLTKQILQENTPENQIKQEVKQEWKSELDKFKEEFEEKEKKSVAEKETQAYNKYVSGLFEKIKSNEEAKFINAMDRHDDVVNAIREYYNQNDTDEPIEEVEKKAIRAVEAALLNEYNNLQAKLGIKDTQSNKSPTLKNSDKASIFRKDNEDLTDNERLKKAIETLQWVED